MGAILALILPLLSKVFGGVTDYFDKKQELEKLKRDAEFELQKANIEMAKELAKSDNERARTALQSTGRYFKYIVFWMISSPFIACLVGQPWYAEMVFNNMNALPDDYRYLYYGLLMVIFGIPTGKDLPTAIINGIKGSIENRRNYKLHKEEIKHSLTDKQFFDKLRDIQGYVSQDQVDKYNAKKDND